MMIPFSILDLAPIVEGGTAVGAHCRTCSILPVMLSATVTIDTGWRNITTCPVLRVPRPLY